MSNNNEGNGRGANPFSWMPFNISWGTNTNQNQNQNQNEGQTPNPTPNTDANTNTQPDTNMPNAPDGQYFFFGYVPDGQGGQDGQGGPGPMQMPLNTMVQSLLGIVQNAVPHKKKRHFTKDALQHLKPVRLADLPDTEADRRCAICFEPFEEYVEPSDETETRSAKKQRLETAELDPQYQEDDPGIPFPVDMTASMEREYHPSVEKPVPRQEPKKKAEELDGHYAVKLPQCEHVFGRSCIAEWLKNNVSCPLCRREVVPEMSEDEQGSGSTRMIFYPVALTEVLIPVDWTGPASDGYTMDDPAVNFPVQGDGYSMGRRTGPEPPNGNEGNGGN